jgi:hypothetical protein
MSRDGDGETRPRRARLDLGHGFLRAVERNQRDRAAYHAAWEERRESDADANRRATGIGVTVIKDGEEWKDPQPWRSFDRDGTGGERQTARRSGGSGDRRAGGSSASAGGSASSTASSSASSARRERDPHAAPARAPESESLDEFAEWWGATGGDDARRGVRDAKAQDAAKPRASRARLGREPNENASGGTRRAAPDAVDQTRTKPKPLLADAERGADHHDPASSKRSADSKAFQQKPATPNPLDEWSALDEELEKALASTKGNRRSGGGGRRR